MKSLSRLVRWLLLRPWFTPFVILLAILLTLPSLWVGWAIDDYYQRWVLVQSPAYADLRPARLDMFYFVDGNVQRNERMKEIGLVPWWIYPGLRGAFWKPVTALTHAVDYTLWPDRPEIMHAHSLVWFMLLLICVALLYRQMMGRTVAAGLAFLLYALDDARVIPVAWLANRNSIIAAVFGVLAIYAHVTWRRDGRRLAAVLAPALLGMSLLGAEAGIAAAAYLVAYAIVLERGDWRERIATLVPYLIVIVAWRIAWSWQGYGVDGVDDFYTDPLNDPLLFFGQMFTRAPIMLLGQWALPPAEIYLLLGPLGLALSAIAAVGGLLLLACILAPLIRRSNVAQFWALGMLLATIPICSTAPMSRHLLFIGIGAMGLLGQFFAVALRPRFWQSVPLPRRIYLGTAIALLVLIHLVLSPLCLLVLSGMPLGPPSALAAVHRIPALTDEDRERDVIIINHPLPFDILHTLTDRAVNGQPLPRSTQELASTYSTLTIRRVDQRTLVVRADEGYFGNVTSELGYSKKHPLVQGETISLPAMTVTILSMTPDGRPSEAQFRFHVPLEDPSLHWLFWNESDFEEFLPPTMGATVVIPQFRLPF